MNKILALATLGMMTVSAVASAFGNNETTFYDEWGSKTGSARQTYNGNVDYYNQWGSKTGSARQGYNGNVEYYDQWGRKTGSSR